MAKVGGGAIQTSDLIADDGGVQSIIRQLTDLRDVVDTLYAKIANGAKLTYGSLKDLAEKNDNYNIVLQETLHAAQAMYKAQEALRLSMSDYAGIIADLKVKASNNNKETKLQAQLSNTVAGSVNHLKFEVADLTRQWENAATAQERASLAGKIRFKTAEIKELKAQLSSVVSTGKQTLTLWDKLEQATSRLFTYTSQFKRNEGLIKQNATLKESKRLMDSLVQVQVKLDALQGKKHDDYIQLAEKKQEFSLAQQLIDLQAKLNALNSTDGKQAIEKTTQLKHQTDLMQKQAELAFAREKAKVGISPDGTPIYSSDTNATIKAKTEFDLEQIRAEADARVRGTEEAIEATVKLQQAEEKTARKIKKLRLEAIIENEEYKDTYKSLAANVEYLRLKMEELPVDSAEWKEARAQLAAYADKLNKASRDMNKNTTVINERKRAWNGLTNATNQIVRELPTVGMRLDTFFLAISNNIPIFIDEINIARQEYINAGKSIKEANKSVTKDVIKNLISWQTAVIVLLTALTQWSKIKDWLNELFGITYDGTYKTEQAYRKLAKAVEGSTKKFAEQLATIRMLKKEWDKATTLEQREKFLRQYNTELEKTGFSLQNVVDGEKFMETYTSTFISALAERAKAAAALSVATEKYSKAIQAEIDLEGELVASQSKRNSTTSSTLGQLVERFGKHYNLQSRTSTGSFRVNRDIMLDILKDYLGIYGHSIEQLSNGTYAASSMQGMTMSNKRMVRDLLKRINAGENGFDIPFRIAGNLAWFLETGTKPSREFSLKAGEYDKSLAQANQFIDKYTDYTAKANKMIDEIGLPTTDEAKAISNIQQLYAESLKYANDKALAAMPDSFDKRRSQLMRNLDETEEEIKKKVIDIENALANPKLSDENRALLQKALANYNQAYIDAAESISRQISELDVDMQIAFNQARIDDLDNYLNAQDTSVQERLDAMKEKIEKERDNALLENSKLEKALRRNENAIMAEYSKKLFDIEADMAIEVRKTRNEDIENIIAFGEQTAEEELKLRREQLKNEYENEVAENNKRAPEAMLDVIAIRNKYTKKMFDLETEFIIKEITRRNADIDNRLASQRDTAKVEKELTKEQLDAELRKALSENNTLPASEQLDPIEIESAYKRKLEIALHDIDLAVVNATEATVQKRLNAINDGNVKELELLKKQANLRYKAELIENARRSPKERLQSLAITEAYYKELERIEREYTIKRNNWLKKQLENEQAASVPNTFTSAQRQMEILRINMQNELLENAELIKEGLISEFDIISKYTRQITKAWSDYNVSVNNAYKTFWDYAAEVANDDTWEQERAGLEALELQKQNELEQNRELIEQYGFLADIIEQVYEKRKKLLSIQKQMARFDLSQQIALTNFGIARQGEQATKRFGLQQELDRLVYESNLKGSAGLLSPEQQALYEAQIASLRKQLRELTPVARVAEHGLIGLLDLTTEEYGAVDTWANQMSESINSVINSYISLAQAAVDASKAQVDAAQRALDAELEARANGYANNVQGAKAELALERSKARQKEAVLRQAQKTQLAIDTVTQVSNLITASAEILKTFAAFPALAYTMIAAMFGTFAVAKVQAYKLANQTAYGFGGYEIAQGGSHASGHDIKTGITTSAGKQMVIEGGEGVGVFSKKAVTKYGDIIPNIVHDINAGTLKQMDYTQDILTATPILPIYSGTDVSSIEQKLDELIAIGNNGQFVLPDGSIVERKGNVTRKIRK